MQNSKTYFMTAIIYVRTYKRESNNLYSLDEQENAIANYAHEKGFRIVKVFREDNVSAKTFERPAFKEMIEYIKSNKWKIKFLIVLDVGRLTTQQGGLQRMRKYMGSQGIKIISILQTLLKYTDKQAKKRR